VARRDEASTLFVYGSLIDPARRIELLGRDVVTAPATLPDYALGRARYFYLRPQPGAVTAGLMLLDLRADDFAVLDRYEELPVLYTREKIEVADADGLPQRCWVYLPTPRTLRGG
jgi:gamma-glutamylcyclotransferase (GGCT)/AIG2-like uncharacterized protein YtfP